MLSGLISAGCVNLGCNRPGEKAALIGRNGAGKSSLFALLTGDLIEDGGTFSFPKTWRLSQVEQHMPETAMSATDYVLAGDTRLNEAQAKLTAANVSGDGTEIGEAHAALADAGAFDARFVYALTGFC